MGRLKLVVAAAAGRDLDSIYDYTATHWGVEQADRYVGSFDAAYQLLLRQPGIGSPSDHGFGYRRLRHERHLIYYSVGPKLLRIERVLHYRMDAPRHLA
ncbi:type II toxin-antitoxin system RelE/ParE family toxin [Sphingomonas psychrotolerans]|uniref:Type II toxin-antitoxin system RelE/ParE family toxin n=1 Tax=Sphingomonas psychrotolerans TaxID=1327635 RepID=A0ABU3N3U1_9SPHN|nr:type II toxin-antitoxin system RelE/ParE family toxin [Sphingomonas psychrotolerans]MDT8758176.1 type II toxin-antitoxin system RelE/ParE family toxin [Sphingomonas psychrotolerans]